MRKRKPPNPKVVTFIGLLLILLGVTLTGIGIAGWYRASTQARQYASSPGCRSALGQASMTTAADACVDIPAMIQGIQTTERNGQEVDQIQVASSNLSDTGTTLDSRMKSTGWMKVDPSFFSRSVNKEPITARVWRGKIIALLCGGVTVKTEGYPGAGRPNAIASTLVGLLALAVGIAVGRQSRHMTNP